MSRDIFAGAVGGTGSARTPLLSAYSSMGQTVSGPASQCGESLNLRLRKYKLGGVRFDALTRRELLSLFGQAIDEQKRIVVLHNNLHGIYLQRTLPSLRAAYDIADWVYIDGMPLVWLAKTAGLPFEANHRITLLDCFEEVLAEAVQKDWRVFYFGGKDEVLAAGLAKIATLFPALNIRGHHGYVSNADPEVLSEITAFGPDILFVGLGMPLQEEWIATHLASLHIPVVTTCGATMEYLTGHAYRPPAWAGNLGLYGLARLIARPRRLWKRYLVEPFVLSFYLVGAIISERLGKLRE